MADDDSGAVSRGPEMAGAFKGSLARRHYAYAIDFLTWHLLGHAFFMWTGLVKYVQEYALPGRYPVLAVAFLFAWRLAFLFKDGIAGYSLGKWSFDLRVIHTDTGRPIGPLHDAGPSSRRGPWGLLGPRARCARRR